MRIRKESTVKNEIKKILIKLRVLATMPMPVSDTGIADFVCCIKGRYVEIEAKSSTGVQSERQRLRQALVRHHNGIYLLVGPDELPELEKALKAI